MAEGTNDTGGAHVLGSDAASRPEVVPQKVEMIESAPAVQQALRNHYFDSLGLPRFDVPDEA